MTTPSNFDAASEVPGLARVLAQGVSVALRELPGVLDQVFLADAYALDATQPTLAAADVVACLNARQADAAVRLAYVDYLKALGCTVDHHGEVQWLSSTLSGLLAEKLVQEDWKRLTARVLRHLHLAGWFGYSRSAPEPMQNYRYAEQLFSQLETIVICYPKVPFDSSWSSAMSQPTSADLAPRVFQFAPGQY